MSVIIPKLKEMKLKDDCISKNFIFRIFQKWKYKKIISLAKKGGQALDVGCGNGIFTMNLSPFFKKVIGLDNDNFLEMEKGGKTALEMAEYLVTKYNIDNVTFQKKDLYNMRFKNNYFNTVFCLEVLEHLADQERVFKEIKKVLKPGGCLVFSVPNTEGLKFIVKNKILELLNVHESEEHFSFDWKECIKKAKKHFYLKKIVFYPLNKHFLSLNVIVLAEKKITLRYLGY